MKKNPGRKEMRRFAANNRKKFSKFKQHMNEFRMKKAARG